MQSTLLLTGLCSPSSESLGFGKFTSSFFIPLILNVVAAFWSELLQVVTVVFLLLLLFLALTALTTVKSIPYIKSPLFEISSVVSAF